MWGRVRAKGRTHEREHSNTRLHGALYVNTHMAASILFAFLKSDSLASRNSFIMSTLGGFATPKALAAFGRPEALFRPHTQGQSLWNPTLRARGIEDKVT